MAYLTLSFKKMINIPNKNPLAVLEDEKLKQIRKLEHMENEMQAMFTKKLNLKLEKMKEFSLNELQKDEKARKELQQQKNELDKLRKCLEVEKNDFNRTLDLSSSPSLSNKSATSTQSALYKKRFTFNVFS